MIEIKPKTSLFGGMEKFKADGVIVSAGTGTAKVYKEDDGSLKVVGGNDV